MYAVLNLKQNLRSTYCSEANDRHEVSRGLFATAELLVRIGSDATKTTKQDSVVFSVVGRNLKQDTHIVLRQQMKVYDITAAEVNKLISIDEIGERYGEIPITP